MPYRTIRKRATYTNIEILDEYYKNKQSVILYLGHYGNWEWLSLAKYAQKSQIKDFMIYPVYHTLSNVAFDRLFINIRKNKNSIPVPQEKILRTMINEKRNNTAALYIFIADQSTSSGNIHYWTNFLNQDTPCISGAERIAKQTNYPVIYLDVTRVKRGHYNIELVPITDNPKELGEFELTEKYMRLMEKTIQRSPAYWLWTHNRWRHKRKKA
jgi:KDO2-lipid IV(A) lauroyltransferase